MSPCLPGSAQLHGRGSTQAPDVRSTSICPVSCTRIFLPRGRIRSPNNEMIKEAACTRFWLLKLSIRARVGGFMGKRSATRGNGHPAGS